MKSPQSEIIRAENFNIISQQLHAIDQQTLIIFDVDDVLFSATDIVLKHPQYLYEQIEKTVKQNEILEFYSIIFSQRSISPTDKRFISLIEELQSEALPGLKAGAS